MIELKNITIEAGKFLLDEVSLTVENGKFHVLLGPTGSGKTILLETIAGLVKPSSGSITINAVDAASLPPEQRGLSYLPQDYALFPHKNVYENIAFGLTLKKNFSPGEINNKISELSWLLNISHLLNRNVHHLSGGEQQRVALARALVLDNSMLILDEPTSSLNETMQEEFCLLLKDLQKRFNLTVLMTTHHKDSAFMLADRLHFIESGKLFLSIDTSKLNHTPLPLKVAELIGITNVLKLKRSPENASVYHSTELNADFQFSEYLHENSEEFELGIKPVDIRVIKEEEKHLNHINRFHAIVEQIIFKESNALVFLKNPVSGFMLKMELSSYNLRKMNIVNGDILLCKIKEEYVRKVY